MRTVWISILLILVLAMWLVLRGPQGVVEQAPSAASDAASPTPEASDRALDSERVVETERVPRSDQPAASATLPRDSAAFVYQQEQRAKSARALVDALLPLVQQDNAAATYALHRLMVRCLGFVGDPRSRNKVTASAGSEDAIWQAKLIEQGRQFCDDPRLADVQGFMAAHNKATAALRAQGDEVAVAQSLRARDQSGRPLYAERQEAQRIKAWELVRQSHNPYAVEAALTALTDFSDPPDSPTAHLSREVSESHGGEHAYVRTLAAMWYACTLGADCRPYGTWQQNACLHQRNCAPHLPLQDFIRERLLTPSQYAAMQRYLDVIRAERARQ